MEIVRKNFDGIEYYLIDIYDDEFSFGTVYHFETDIGDKYCFYEENTYIPIENKKYLKKIKEKLEINTNIIYKKLDKDLIKIRMGMLLSRGISDISDIKDIFGKIERLNSEEEYEVYDSVSKIINELYPDISYEDTMNVLDDDSGIYFLGLPNRQGGFYNSLNHQICLNYRNDEEYLKDSKLHESIHKLTNRNGYIKNNAEKFIGLIEGGTAKICESKYGDKTSHSISIGDTKVHINFSGKSTYQLEQIIYRQMGQLVDPQMEDEALVNGNFDIFLNKFREMYGKDLLIYLSHRAKMLVLNKNEKKTMRYFKEAQKMLLTKAFDKKRLNVETEEDIVNYMTELKNFEYYIGRISGDNTFETYYRSKYNDIVDMAKQKGIDLSKIEEFEYSPVEFYPVKNSKESSLSNSTEIHIMELSTFHNKNLDLEKYTRIQVKDLPNFYNLDVVLQDGIPISSSSTRVSKYDEDSSIYKDFGVDWKNADIYYIGNNGVAEAFMIINSDGTSEICSRSYETSRIYKGTINQIDLGINLADIKKYDEETSFTFVSEECIENKENLLNKLKTLFRNLVHRNDGTIALPDAIANNTTNSTINNNHKTRNSFLDKLNPNNKIYDQSTIGTFEERSEVSKESVKGEIENG